MSEKEAPAGVSFGKALLIAVAVIFLIAAVIVGLEAAKLSASFAFVLFLWYFTVTQGTKRENLLPTWVGGIVGIVVGNSQAVFNLFMEPYGMIPYLILMVITVALLISNLVPVFVNNATALMMTILMIGGTTGIDMLGLEVIVYSIAALVFLVITTAMAKGAKKKASQQASA